MPDSLRIRGQEILIRISQAGKPLRTLTAVKSMTWTPKFDILREGYLGEVTDRRDDIYRGSAIELTFHPESQDAFVLIGVLRDRAMRRTSQAQARVNVTFTAEFPNGDRPRLTIADIKFSDIPMNMSARDQYVDVRLSGEAEDFTLAGI
jgi:hypothetical protein